MKRLRTCRRSEAGTLITSCMPSKIMIQSHWEKHLDAFIFIAVGGEHVIKVRVPATAANIGPGFDCLGVALNIYNDIEVEECNEGLSINISGERCGDVPVDETNLVYRSMKKVLTWPVFLPRA